MKFFKNKKNDDSRRAVQPPHKDQAPWRRRSFRLRLLRVRSFGAAAVICAGLAAAGFSCYQNGSFKKMNSHFGEWMLAATSDAGFTVKDILLTGRVQISTDDLRAHLTIRENMPIFGVSIAEAQKSLMNLPWVRSVSISRRLPDKIIVELKEREPVALWQYRKKISLIDQDGIVLTAHNLSAWKHLPLIVGADAQKHIMEMIQLLNAEPLLARDVVSATRVGGRRWDLHLKNGLSIKLPERDMELALRRLAVMEQQENILGRSISGIDLRHPERVVVTPVIDNNNKKTTI